MSKPDLRAMAAHPEAFRDVVLIDTDRGPVPLASIADPWQLADFAALDDAWRLVAGHQVQPAAPRAYLERPRGHSKTSDLAVMATWALAFSRRRLSGVAAAADREQARLLRDAISRLVSANPWLTGTLDVQAYRVINTRTESSLEILSSDAATSYGLTPDFIIVDELTHWTNRDLWDSLISSAAKRGHCVVVVISNAGWGDTWQWATREAIRTDPRWYFSRLDGPTASWITPDRLDEQQRLLPRIAYERLWLNRWTSGSGDALDPDVLTAALTMAVPPANTSPGESYFAGLDLSTRQDATGLVILGRDDGWSEERSLPRHRLPSTVAALADLGLVDAAEPEPQVIEHAGSGRLRLIDVQLWEPNGQAHRPALPPRGSCVNSAAPSWTIAATPAPGQFASPESPAASGTCATHAPGVTSLTNAAGEHAPCTTTTIFSTPSRNSARSPARRSAPSTTTTSGGAISRSRAVHAANGVRAHISASCSGDSLRRAMQRRRAPRRMRGPPRPSLPRRCRGSCRPRGRVRRRVLPRAVLKERAASRAPRAGGPATAGRAGWRATRRGRTG